MLVLLASQLARIRSCLMDSCDRLGSHLVDGCSTPKKLSQSHCAEHHQPRGASAIVFANAYASHENERLFLSQNLLTCVTSVS